MAVSLTVRTEDQELEQLLDYLETHGDHEHIESKIWLLEKATKWLQASRYISYSCRPDEVSISLSTGAEIADTALSLR